MMDAIFDWCVQVLVSFASVLGITYKEINVWVFVIIWPILTFILIVLVVRQQARIRRLERALEESMRIRFG
jgi:Flp pilus assembly protein TadB